MKMGRMEIFLSDKAFLSIILSCVEVYHNECLGVLLGYKTRNRVFVEYAIPFQSAKRSTEEVIPNWRREAKVIEILPKMIHLEKLGYYHSHPQDPKNRRIKGIAELSQADKESMEVEEVELIVAVNDALKKSAWDKTARGGLSGTIGNYRFKIAGFYKRSSDNEIRRYRVLCPYAVGFDYTFED
jgi:proteasome lid subunit RPN8/RPN11